MNTIGTYLERCAELHAELLDAQDCMRTATQAEALRLADETRERLSIARRETALALPPLAQLLVGLRSLLDVVEHSKGVVGYRGRRQVYGWDSYEDLDLIHNGVETLTGIVLAWETETGGQAA